MNANAGKAFEERGIFERFSADAELRIVPGTLVQPDPPDILCQIEGMGQVAFELVQLDARQELARMKDFQGIRALWAEVMRTMTPELRQRCRCAQIDVEFNPHANQRVRRAVLTQLVVRLGELPEGFSGPLFEEEMPAGLSFCEVRSFDFVGGPRINEVSTSGPTELDLSRIDEKVAHYSQGWGVRAELLAYARWGMPFSDQPHDAAEYLAARFPAGIFARAWIYELTSRLIVAHAP